MKSEILDFIHEGIVVTNEDFTIVYFNKAFENFFSRDILSTHNNIIEVISFPRMDVAFEMAKGGRVFFEETPVYFGDKRMECSVRVFREENKFNWIFNDMTNAKILQNAKADFVSSVSHEFMTPLGIIEGFLSIIKDSQLSENLRKKYVNRSLVQLKRLEKLVDQLLSLSELEMKKYIPNFSVVNISEMLSEAKEEMIYRWKAKNIEVNVHTKRDIFVKTDGNALYRIFTNLLSNAIKYSFDHSEVNIRVKENVNEIRVSFEDHGIGIKEEEIPRIFERFYRASNCIETKARGMGLGLSLVKHLCDVINAKIEVSSKYTMGTTFTLILPK